MLRSSDRAVLGAMYGLLAFLMGQIGVGMAVASLRLLHFGVVWGVLLIPLAAAGFVLGWLSTRGLAQMLRHPFIR